MSKKKIIFFLYTHLLPADVSRQNRDNRVYTAPRIRRSMSSLFSHIHKTSARFGREKTGPNITIFFLYISVTVFDAPEGRCSQRFSHKVSWDLLTGDRFFFLLFISETKPSKLNDIKYLKAFLSLSKASFLEEKKVTGELHWNLYTNYIWSSRTGGLQLYN